MIDEIRHDGGRITGIATKAGLMTADAYVLALGSYSPLLADSLGLRLPVYPVKGYSITVPITDATGAPESTVMDETYKVARSEEHTSELQSLMRISYAVFCLQNKKTNTTSIN